MRDKISSISEKDVSVENFMGHYLAFEQVVGFIASKFPEGQREGFIDRTTRAFSEVRFNMSSERGPRKIKFRYKNRFMNPRVDRYKSAVVLWATQPLATKEQFHIFVDRTINLIAESSFIPVRRSSVFVRSHRAFTSDNIEAIKDKILLKMYTLDTKVELGTDSRVRLIYNQMRNILSGFLPLQFSEIRRVRLTQEYVDVYHEGGPQALYRLLRIRYGVGLSIKYWMTHLANAHLALTIIYASFMAPQVVQTYNFIINQQSVVIERPNEYEVGVRLLEVMRTPPQQLLVELNEHLNSLPIGEARHISRFLREVGEAYSEVLP